MLGTKWMLKKIREKLEKKMTIYVVFEKGPDSTSMIVTDDLEKAEALVRAEKHWWKDCVRLNKIPQRHYTIKTFKEV